MRKLQLVIYSIVGWYLLLIILHYFNQRPLWNDEYCIFLNIYGRSVADFFQGPLTHFQQFPRIYLYFIGQWARIFNFHLLALRFFPFVCMSSAFFIWLYLAKKQVRSVMGLLTFFLCWVASAPLIYYAAELKQYSMDVLATTVFLLFLYHQKNLQQNVSGVAYALILMVLPLFGLFSYPVFFFLLLPIYNILVDIRNNPRLWPFLVIYLMSCLSVFGVVYCLDLRVSNVAMLGADWHDHMISLHSAKEFLKTLGENLDNLISRWFVERPKWIRRAARFFVGLGFIRLFGGAWGVFKRDGFRLCSIHSIAFVVFWEHLILSVFKKYPFAVVRTSLFFAPMLLFLTVDALEWLKQRNGALYALVQYPFMVYLLYISLGIAGMIFAGDLGAQPVIWR